jgi:beta-barrel assembly-enhancing protease
MNLHAISNIIVLMSKCKLNFNYKLLALLLIISAMHSLSYADTNTEFTYSAKPYSSSSDLDTKLPQDSSNNLPDLGDVSQTVLTPLQEQRIAEQILHDVYSSDEVLQDIEVSDYIQALGNKLVASSPDKHQQFTFFVVKDHSINAFAMPGGVIGVHTGLIVSTNNESELASVLGHEIGHVTQHHMARMLASQKYDVFKNIAATALAILVARSNPQLASGAMTTVAAANIQGQLDYTREHEREADRVGLTILNDAGFDVRAMPAFFTTLQRGTQFIDNNAPSYLRTHPLTSERIADVSNRVQNMPYHQVADSLDFYLARAKVRAAQDLPRNTVELFEQNINERRFSNEVAEHYGLALAYLRANDITKAQTQMQWLIKNAPAHPNFSSLNARILEANHQTTQALDMYTQALKKYPMHRGLIYGKTDLLVNMHELDSALKFINDNLALFPNDANLYASSAKVYSMQAKVLLMHQAQAESYYHKYDLRLAVEQMELATKAKDGNFYQQSIVEARLKQLKRLFEDEKQARSS